ncbi:MAG: SGNH/GDSL hydrolase family protein [Alphaproteobacteria bacterium]
MSASPTARRIRAAVTRLMVLGMTAVLCAAVVASCGNREAEKEGGLPMLALGDSIFAWHRKTGQSIPDVVAVRLNRPVFNASVGGAFLSHPNLVLRASDQDIRTQYAGGTWDWILFEGGANDLAAECRCEDCAAVLDGLIDAKARDGDIPRFLSRLTQMGSRVMIVGYYHPGRSGRSFFKACTDELAALNERLARLAQRDRRLFFVSAADMVSPDDPADYSGDMIHPSVRASLRVGHHVAQAINAAGGRGR